MSTLATLKDAAHQKIIVAVPLSEFHPPLAGEIHVHVNPSRKRFKQLRGETDKDKYLTLVGELIVDPETGQGLTPAEAKQFFEDDDADPALAAWLAKRVVDLVNEHLEKNFLLPKGS